MDKHSYIIRCCMVLWGLLVVSCSSIDCPLNNRVHVIYKLQGDETPLSDSLTISTNRINRNDTVLLNHVVNTDSFQIPISYQHPEDVLYFRRSNSTGLNIIDTVIIKRRTFRTSSPSIAVLTSSTLSRASNILGLVSTLSSSTKQM